jgi:hypothetical protein
MRETQTKNKIENLPSPDPIFLIVFSAGGGQRKERRIK